MVEVNFIFVLECRNFSTIVLYITFLLFLPIGRRGISKKEKSNIFHDTFAYELSQQDQKTMCLKEYCVQKSYKAFQKLVGKSF